MKVSKNKRLKFYKSKAWLNKRKEILERDNHECQHCKSKGYVTSTQTSRLDVHHIKHLEDRWDLRLNSDNLITLCSACHNLEHPEKLRSQESKVHKERFE